MSYGSLNNLMDATTKIGRNPVRKNQIQPEYGNEQAAAGRDCLSRENKFSDAKGNREIYTFLFS